MKRQAMPSGDGPPRLSVPTSTLSPPLTNTFGRSAVALDSLATGPAATVMYWPAGTPDIVNLPASSVRALTEVFCTATSTAPAGRPLTGMGRVPGTGWGIALGASGAPGWACASGAIGRGMPRTHGPHITRPVIDPVTDWAVAP